MEKREKKPKTWENFAFGREQAHAKKLTISVRHNMYFLGMYHNIKRKNRSCCAFFFYLGTKLPTHPAFCIMAMETSVADR